MLTTTKKDAPTQTRKIRDFVALTKRPILSAKQIITKYALKKNWKKTGNITEEIDTIAYGR